MLIMLHDSKTRQKQPDFFQGGNLFQNGETNDFFWIHYYLNTSKSKVLF